MNRTCRTRSEWWQLSRRTRNKLLKSWTYYLSMYNAAYKKFIRDLNMTEYSSGSR